MFSFWRHQIIAEVTEARTTYTNCEFQNGIRFALAVGNPRRKRHSILRVPGVSSNGIHEHQ